MLGDVWVRFINRHRQFRQELQTVTMFRPDGQVHIEQSDFQDGRKQGIDLAFAFPFRSPFGAAFFFRPISYWNVVLPGQLSPWRHRERKQGPVPPIGGNSDNNAESMY